MDATRLERSAPTGPGARAGAGAPPAAEAVMGRARGENFPVASRLLAGSLRRHLLAIYGFARLVDELGDAYPGDRLAALDWLEEELDGAFTGRPGHPLLAALAPTIAQCSLSREPFIALIEANRQDQRITRYETFEQLRAYCELSANPVGRLVLEVLRLATPQRLAYSDSICTALQLAEHWQDLAEDMASGRIYLPARDMRRFAVSEPMLAGAHASPELRALLAFEVARARALLDAGAPLIRTLRGRPRLAIAGFVGGGRAALAAIARARYDVLAGAPRASRARVALALVQALARSPRAA